MKRKTAESSKLKGASEERQFYAEAEYADSIFRDARGDREGSIVALKRALEAMPTYAPAILSMGSVWYQVGKIADGRELFQSLLLLPKNTTDICQIIDEAGTFLIRLGAYEDGRALYRAAVKRYPDVAALFQGLGYCASNAGLHEEAVSANQRALELEPENQKSWSTIWLGLSCRPAASRRLGKPSSERSRWIQAMSWRKRICVFASGSSHGGRLTSRETHRRTVRAAENERRQYPPTTNTAGQCFHAP